MSTNTIDLDAYLDTARYNLYFDSLSSEKRQRFKVFKAKCYAEAAIECSLNEFETAVINYLLLRYYFML